MKYTLRNTLILFITILSIGCTKDLKRDIKDLNDRLDNIQSEEIATFTEQIEHINSTLAALNDLDKILLERLDNMPDNDQMRDELEAQRQQLQKAIDALKAYVDGENSNVKDWANSLFATLDALKNLKDYVDSGDSELKDWANNLFATIESLKTLKQYVNDSKKGVEDWVKASYTTLTMHNLLAEVVAELKGKLDKLPDASTLDARFKSLENSMKTWVNSQLSGYITIADAEARLAAQKKLLEDKISDLETSTNDNAEDIKKLQDSVKKLSTASAQMKIDITKEYQDAISKAIKDFDGKVDAKIAEKLKAVNAEINNLKQQISGITSKISDLEAELARLKGLITSLTYIPTHDDGKARVMEIQSSTINSEFTLALDFTVRPASAAKVLKEKKDSLTVSYVSTIKTKAPVINKLQIDSVTWDEAQPECIKVFVDIAKLPDAFFAEEASASLTLKVKDSDTGNDIASPFIPLTLQKISSYLTFKSEGSTELYNGGRGSASVKLYYSYDLRTWKEWDYTTVQLKFGKTEPLYIYGDNPNRFNMSIMYFTFGTNGDNFSVEGNIMALKNRYSPGEVIPEGEYFLSLFHNNTILKDAKNLLLPATTLAGSCYSDMFRNCTSLATAPELPATTLAGSCYSGMFRNCTSLATAPELPATTLAANCYEDMFFYCSSLKTAPELPATTLAEYCYYGMFSTCRSLATAPELPATTLADYCYNNMFSSCTSLETAPELPATTLAEACYLYMFASCTSLKTAPELPATTLAKSCYQYMFNSCTSLKTAPELPAATLSEGCYIGMFRYSGVTSVKCHATSFKSDDLGYHFLYGVPAGGTFYGKTEESAWRAYIPTGWTYVKF